MIESDLNGMEIAVIGMAGRFAGAANISEFWENLKNSIEAISFFSDQELEQSGVSPALINQPGYVKARGILENKEYFDALFFGYTPNEAVVMDPQMRIFHESAWEALENAGYDPGAFDGLIGIYAGASPGFKWEALTLLSGENNNIGEFETSQLTNRDFLCTRLSFKLDLKGPAVCIQTACSTSLAAIHTANQALLNGECDMALAGGVTITTSKKTGYLYREGMINSPDGHCRTFSAEARGTVGGEGAGLVVLKRYEDALAHRDHIYALIKGSAINNDGKQKVGFFAPGIKGQAEVIRTALQMAEIEPETITYVETHGTGTILGDPVEIEALKQGFNTKKKNFCALGSVKTNLGHLDCAAGAASFIKTVLAITHRLIPPNLHFTTPNPKIDFDNSPFYVNNRLQEWTVEGHSLRAGVSSFGIGGTNVHVVLEQAPMPVECPCTLLRDKRTDYQLILLSAQSDSALEKITGNLVGHFKKHPHIDLADAAYTLQAGRRPFPYRKMCVCTDVDETIAALSDPRSPKVKTFFSTKENPPVIFMFPGQGSQYVNMGLHLYRSEPVFRGEMDRCFEILQYSMGLELKNILYPGVILREVEKSDENSGMSSNPFISEDSIMFHKSPVIPFPSPINHIDQTEITQPLLFIFEYALARLIMEWGIEPYAMIGHSIGEYTAACLSGVFSLEHALELVALRGKLMQQIPGGAMLSVPMSPQELNPLLPVELSLAAINSTSSCVVSGTHQVIDSFERQLHERGINGKRLHTSHAFHSDMMTPILDEFQQAVGNVTLNKPSIPYISNVTGSWTPIAESTHPAYWADHLKKTVRFSDGLGQLFNQHPAVFLEIGPGHVLSTFVRQHDKKKDQHMVLNLIQGPGETDSEIDDIRYIKEQIGQLWLYGKKINWEKFYRENAEQRHRIVLPTYPFEGQRYWPDNLPQELGEKLLPGNSQLYKKPEIKDWFYIPVWKQSPLIDLESEPTGTRTCWLLFADECGLGTGLWERLNRENREVICVKAGKDFEEENDKIYCIDPANPGHYDTLFEKIHLYLQFHNTRQNPGKMIIIHLWNVTANNMGQPALENLDHGQVTAFYSLLYLVQALGKHDPGSVNVKITVVTNNMQTIIGEETLAPVKSLVLGPCQVIPREYPHITCQSIDILLPEQGSNQYQSLLEALISEFTADLPDSDHNRMIAFRGKHRWTRTIEPVQLHKTATISPRLKPGGVYLITGGLGGIGFVLARHLASTVNARLILTGRSAFPPREEWDQWLSRHNGQDPTTIKIKEIRELEKQGARVLVLSADTADTQKMKNVIDRITGEFGIINGVIHCAGVPDGAVIQLNTRKNWHRVLEPKVNGTLVLDSLLKDRQLDFFILCSSLSSILAPLGQVGYCAANAFLDSYAHYKTAEGTFTVSINWDAWQEVGMAVRAVDSPDELRNGILPHEGIEVFDRILHRTLPQAAVSTRDLNALLERHRKKNKNKTRDSAARETGTDQPETNEPHPHRQRPALTTPYAAPRNETEQTIAAIWERIFGFKPIGINDNFFEIGGDSLKALHASSLLNDAGIEIPVHKLILQQTIHNISTALLPPEVPAQESRISLESSSSLSISVSSLSPGSFEFPESLLPPLSAPLKKTTTQKLEKEIQAELRRNSQLTLLLKENKKTDEYPVSPIQQTYLSPPYTGIATHIIMVPYDLAGPANIEQIKEILIQLFNKNSLLRSFINDTGTGYRIEEYASFSNIPLPFSDISGCREKFRDKLINLIYAILNQPFTVIDELLYRFIVLKLDNTHHKIIFAFNHLIFDGDSIGILIDKMDNICKNVLYNLDLQEESTTDYTYKDYTHFINHRDYDSIDLNEYLDLPDYIKYVEKAVNTFQVEELTYDSFEIDISMMTGLLKSFYNEIILLGFASLISQLFILEKVPLLFVSSGRNYKGGNFSNIIGDFHDRIPMLFTFSFPFPFSFPEHMENNPGLMVEKLIQYRRYASKNNLNFTGYFLKKQETGMDLSKLLSPFSFNSLIGSYQHFKSEQENETLRRLTRQKLSSDSPSSTSSPSLSPSPSPFPLFQVSLIEDFYANKLGISIWQNSHISKKEIKEIFIKNYFHLVQTLNSEKKLRILQ